jgi:hypothetical protein
MSTVDPVYFFQGSLPEGVPIATNSTIQALTAIFDADRLEVLVSESYNDRCFFVIALVFLNKARDEGYFFNGLLDTNDCRIAYPRASDVLDALHEIADDQRMELSIFLEGGVTLPCEPDNFFNQLKELGVYWRKNSEQKALDTTPIPNGSNCDGCPYYHLVADRPEQESGYCAWLDYGDWMNKLGFSLLWDGLKECDVKRD